MEDVKEDIKMYPSLPPNYVSLAQLQERWIQQQQQKQKEQEEKEQVAIENQKQPEERKMFDRNRRSSKSGEGRIRAQGVNVRQNGDRRVDNRRLYGPWRQSNGNRREIWEAKSVELKSEKLELRAASGDEGGNGMTNAMYEKKNKYNRNKRRPRVEGKSRGKGLVNGQFSSSTNDRRVEGKSRGKQVVNGQFCSSTDEQMVEGKSCGKDAVNGHFLSNTDDGGVEGSVNEYMLEVLPENVSEEEVSAVLRGKDDRRHNPELERSDNDQGLVEEGNERMLEVLQANEFEKEVRGDERRKTGKERFRGKYQGNEGNRRMKRNFNDNKLQLELGQQLVEEGVFMGQKEKEGPKARTGRGDRGYGNKLSDNRGPMIRRHFGDLSLDDSKKGTSYRGQRGSYGNFGKFTPHREGKQVDGGLVWVKKEEISDTNAAKIS